MTCIEPDTDRTIEDLGLLSREIVRTTRTLAITSDGPHSHYIPREHVRTALVHLRYVARNLGVDVN